MKRDFTIKRKLIGFQHKGKSYRIAPTREECVDCTLKGKRGLRDKSKNGQIATKSRDWGIAQKGENCGDLRERPD